MPAVHAAALPAVRAIRREETSATLARFLLPFEDPARTLIHALKYGRRISAANFLVEAAAPTLGDLRLERIDLIVPIPLHPVRHRERGYNQASLLASEFGRRLGLPTSDSLRRIRATADQTGLPRAGRLTNVRGAFEAATDVHGGARVLLVDDVITTGATLAEAAAELTRAGARSVECLALAGRVGSVLPPRCGLGTGRGPGFATRETD